MPVREAPKVYVVSSVYYDDFQVAAVCASPEEAVAAVLRICRDATERTTDADRKVGHRRFTSEWREYWIDERSLLP